MKCNRRRFLNCTLGAAGYMLAGGMQGTASKLLAAASAALDKSKDAPTSPVAIQRCESYEPAVVRARINAAIDLIGGIGKLVNGKTVTIKINVTGGPGELGGLPGYRTYHIHPNLLAALCAAIHDGGAKRIVIVESQYSLKTPEEVLGGAGWDINAIKAAGGHTVIFEDTRNRGSWPRYSTLKVPWGGFLFPSFMLNQWYEKTDVFVSLSKMKDHLCAGVTLSIKNLFGISPTALYGGDAPNEKTVDYRGPMLHNGARSVPAGVPAELAINTPVKDWRSRVPRITADLLGVRPIDLAVVDGVESNRGGEGPWCGGVEPVAPKLLFVGRNPVCLDAIGTVAMGYNPQAQHFEFPFAGENHLRLLESAGVGTIDPKRIEVLGLPLDKAIYPYNPKHVPLDWPTAMYSSPRLYHPAMA